MTRKQKREIAERMDWLVGKLADPNGKLDDRAPAWREELHQLRAAWNYEPERI